MIVSGGENVFPREVEDLLADHDSIKEAAVIGVDDEKFGQRLKAFVVLADGKDLDEDGSSPTSRRTSPATRSRARSSSWTSCRATPPARSSSASWSRGRSRMTAPDPMPTAPTTAKATTRRTSRRLPSGGMATVALWKGEHMGGVGSSAGAGIVLPLRPRAQAAIVALGLVIVVDLVALVFDFNLLSTVNRILDGEVVSPADANAADNNFENAAAVQLVAVGISALTFILWYARGYRNVMTMGLTVPRYRMSWAVISWFVPIAALVNPKRVVDDIYRTSDPEMPFGRSGFRLAAGRASAGLVVGGVAGRHLPGSLRDHHP